MAVGKNSLWSIGSGKGGVGKSFLAACIGTACARLGKSVVLVDANLSAPDLSGFLGIKTPALTLRKIINDHMPAAAALIKTPEPNLSFVSCTGDEFGMADLNPGEHIQLLESIRSLKADLVLMDLAAGSASTTLDFLNYAQHAMILSSPDPASMRCTYRLIRNAILRRIQDKFGADSEIMTAIHDLNPGTGTQKSKTMGEFLSRMQSCDPEMGKSIATVLEGWKPNLLITMTDSEQDCRMGEIIQTAAVKFLNVDVKLSGSVAMDPGLRRASPRMLEFSENTPTPALRQIRELAFKLAGDICRTDNDEEPSQPATACMPVMGLNDNLILLGRDVHVQTEDLRAAGNGIITQVFCEGRVILSAKSECKSSRQNSAENGQVLEKMRVQHFNVIRQIENRTTKVPASVA